MNHKYNRRILQVVRATEKRLGKLPALIRKEFKAGTDRQLHALRRVEHAIEVVARETKANRELLEMNPEALAARQLTTEHERSED